jgi:signal transduction histidine kinase
MLRVHLRPHPFRLLLILEWILLGLAAFKIFDFPRWAIPQLWTETAGLFPNTKESDLLQLAGILIVFGGMGLWLPVSLWAKRIYIAIAFGLIVMAGNILNWGLEALSPLLIVILLRSCLLFQQQGRWLMAGLIWLVYPITLAPVLLIFWFLLNPQFISYWRLEQPNHGVTLMPNGGLQIHLSFSSDQVKRGLAFAQDAILHFLLDNLLSFGLVLICVLLLVNSVVNERQGRRKLALAHEQLYQYSLQIEDQATLQERTRIAREIHDSLGHLLTAQSVLLENATLSLFSNVQETKLFLDDSKRLGADARHELRQALLMLHSDPLEGKLFEQAIADLTTYFKRITNIQLEYQIDIPVQLPHRIQVAIYRILQEALNNVQKHSQATQINIKLMLQPDVDLAKSPVLQMQIEDDGRGFNPEQNQTGFGLQGMQERATSLGGQMQLITQPEAGCQINITLPLLGVTR